MKLPGHVPLVVATRGDAVESVHHGSIAVVDAAGRLVCGVGDVEFPVFTRSTLKPFQALPFVVDVYHRDLVIEQYFIGYLLHPYVSLYTGRGCRSKCTFCLWPQTVGGQRYRTRSVEHVVAEIGRAQRDRKSTRLNSSHS